MAAPQSIAVIGLGYIGLPTAVVLAQRGTRVFGVDVDQRKATEVNEGRLPFVEPGLGEALAEVVGNGTLTASTDTPKAEAYVVAVPTPFQPDHSADLSYVLAAARNIAPNLEDGNLVVLESTSPPGATEKMAEELLAARPDLSLDGADGKGIIHVAHCPERVLPGRVMEELVENDRIIGGMTPAAAEAAKDLYAIFCEGELLTSDAKTAEMSKLTENAFRDVNIAFANELSVICDRLGIDVWELISLANHHPRVNILQPGPGVGGHCIAVDPWFIISAAPEQARLMHAARNVNDDKPQLVRQKVLDAVAATGATKVAALGLAFKANIDDLRESPARSITGAIARELPNVQVLAVEPNITELPAELAALDNVSLAAVGDALAAAEVIVLLVDHQEFKTVDHAKLEGKQIIDTKGLWR